MVTFFSFWKLDWHHIYVHTYPFMKATRGGRRQRESFDSLRTLECVVIQLKRPTGTETGHRVSQCQRQDLQWKSLENPVIAWGWTGALWTKSKTKKKKQQKVFSSYVIFLSKCGAIYCCTPGSVLADEKCRICVAATGSGLHRKPLKGRFNTL